MQWDCNFRKPLLFEPQASELIESFLAQGWACPNADCTVRLHKNCQTVLNRGGKCPGEAEGCTECVLFHLLPAASHALTGNAFFRIWSRLAGKPYTGFPVGLEASNDDAAFVDDEDELATQIGRAHV